MKITRKPKPAGLKLYGQSTSWRRGVCQVVIADCYRALFATCPTCASKGMTAFVPGAVRPPSPHFMFVFPKTATGTALYYLACMGRVELCCPDCRSEFVRPVRREPRPIAAAIVGYLEGTNFRGRTNPLVEIVDGRVVPIAGPDVELKLDALAAKHSPMYGIRGL